MNKARAYSIETHRLKTACPYLYLRARPKYIEVFLNNLVNWDFVASNFAKK